MRDRDIPAHAAGDPNNATKRGASPVEHIKVLDSIEAVRLRPEMYIGPDREAGLIQLIEPTVDTLLREGAQHIEITLQPGNIVAIRDDGSGLSPFPVGPQESRPWAQYCLTELLTGFGAPALVFCNALSQWLELKIERDGYQWEQSYRQGRPQDELHKIGPTKKHGNSIRFLPDPEIFPGMEYDFDKLVHWCRERASNLERKIAQNDPGGFYGEFLRRQTAFFRKTYFIISDERAAVSNANGVQRITFPPLTAS